MPISVGKTVLNYVFWLVIILILVAGSAMLAPRVHNRRVLGARRAELESENRVQQQALADLQRKQSRFRDDPEFVEHVARQNRRARPGEVVFLFEVPAE